MVDTFKKHDDDLFRLEKFDSLDRQVKSLNHFFKISPGLIGLSEAFAYLLLEDGLIGLF